MNLKERVAQVRRELEVLAHKIDYIPKHEAQMILTGLTKELERIETKSPTPPSDWVGSVEVRGTPSGQAAVYIGGRKVLSNLRRQDAEFIANVTRGTNG